MVNCIAWRVSWWPCCAFLMSSIGAEIFHGGCWFCFQTCSRLWLTSLIILVKPILLPSTQPHCSYPSFWLTIWKFGAIAFNIKIFFPSLDLASKAMPLLWFCFLHTPSALMRTHLPVCIVCLCVADYPLFLGFFVPVHQVINTGWDLINVEFSPLQ